MSFVASPSLQTGRITQTGLGSTARLNACKKATDEAIEQDRSGGMQKATVSKPLLLVSTGPVYVRSRISIGHVDGSGEAMAHKGWVDGRRSSTSSGSFASSSPSLQRGHTCIGRASAASGYRSRLVDMMA